MSVSTGGSAGGPGGPGGSGEDKGSGEKGALVQIGHYVLGETLGIGTFGKVKGNKTGVINDPLGQTQTKVLASFRKVGPDVRTTCAKSTITTERDCGWAELINLSSLHE